MYQNLQISVAGCCWNGWPNTPECAGAMVDLSKPYLSKSTDDLNNGSFLFNCQNGTLDLKTGGFNGHKRSDFLTQIAGVDFNASSKCPRFNKFIDEIFDGDIELAHYVQTMCGYCLTGKTNEQKMFLLYGNGANGKGTLIEVVKSIMGSYASTAQAETLMQKAKVSGGEASPDIARLVDTRAVMLAEGDRSHHFNEAFVKQLTGQDTVTARELYGKPFEFQPAFKLLLSTNYLPKVRGTDEGIWRRLTPIPFKVSFKGNQMDKNLRAVLLSEGPGILNWMIEGCNRWQKEGLIEPSSIIKSRATYQSDSDNIIRFLEDVTIKNSEATITKSGLYLNYQKWVKLEGEYYTAPNREFSKIIGDQAHIVESRTKEARNWKGIEFQPNERGWCSL